MTRNEVLDLMAVAIREMTRWGFRVWRRPESQKVVDAARFIRTVVADEWWCLENPPGPVQTEEEVVIEAVIAEFQSRGATISVDTARAFYESGGHKQTIEHALPVDAEQLPRKAYRRGSPTKSAWRRITPNEVTKGSANGQ
jgi:hypothetical protein